MRKLLRRLSYFRNRRQMDADLAEEMEFHRALLDRACISLLRRQQPSRQPRDLLIPAIVLALDSEYVNDAAGRQ